ncbi:hypothetical protein [Pseudoalteromonas sp. 10-33]|uniref:hypothetical protein n=1 Tax=Pseudoalteromonas sp. 10-33 TaxID=1761890 RepID=UPI000AD3DC9A|nr:hypothetical protein [Pseudoalteromonas sp. 10-33]
MNKVFDGIALPLKIVTSSDINEEANGNMLSFTFDLFEREEEFFSLFLNYCTELYKNTVNDELLTIYCWLDELAGQIRLSAVSQSHEKLPFRVDLNNLPLEQFCESLVIGCSGIYSKPGNLNVWQTYL